MVGGYLTFSGVAKARWGRTSLAEALPVRILDIDDHVELSAGAGPMVVQELLVVAGLAAPPGSRGGRGTVSCSTSSSDQWPGRTPPSRPVVGDLASTADAR